MCYTKASKWKASELRLFTLYVAPVVLYGQKILSKDKYNNFLKLTTGMRILLSDDQLHNMGFVEQLLNSFVCEVTRLYSKKYISYNTHQISHLHQDYRKYGNLSEVDCFAFESFLGRIKLSVKSGYKPQKQAAKFCSSNNKQMEIYLKPLSERKLRTCNSYVTCGSLGSKDNIVLHKERVAIIVKISHEAERSLLVLKYFRDQKDLFKSPTESSNVGIFLVDSLDRKFHEVPLSEIQAKMMLLPHYKKFVAIALLHSNNV